MNRGRMLSRACGPFLFALLLGACSDETRPSAAENEQLDDAAEMLNAAPATLENIDAPVPAEPEPASQPTDEGPR